MNPSVPLSPQAIQDKYELFAELSYRFRAKTGLEAVLVGGSAYEWHFPSLHSSDDLDVVIQATVGRVREFEGVLVAAGFVQTGRCWSSPVIACTVEVVGTTLALAPKGVGADVLIAQATLTGSPFTLSTATIIWCDRAMAWEALPHSQRDARHTLLAAKGFRDKIDGKRAREVLKAAGVLDLLLRRAQSMPEWNGHADIFEQK